MRTLSYRKDISFLNLKPTYLTKTDDQPKHRHKAITYHYRYKLGEYDRELVFMW